MPKDDNKTVFVKLNKFESKVLATIDSTYKKFINKNGCIIVKLNKALYGCIESARLWYDKLSTELLNIGFVKNKVDPCVFNRTEVSDGTQTTLLLHVDDMFITSQNEDILTNVIKEIGNNYQSLTIQRGKILEFLGMTFDFSVARKVRITMNGFINDFLSTCKHIEGESIYPANENLFKINKDATLLNTADKEFYHSVTAKSLYLGKRVRPDILTAVSFLTKRVNNPTEQDFNKLIKLIRYIRHTKHMGIILEGEDTLSVLAYVDASYGVHSDYKSHTGCVIGIGRGPIYAKSSGQKINTKSSSEAELIGLSDSTNQVIWTRNFLLEQGYNVGPATIYEDNQSTIAMIKNGKSNSERTRHIAVRFYFLADRIASKEIRMEYLQTTDMLADILTKPLQGQLFIKLRNRLLNWYDNELIDAESIHAPKGSVDT